MVMTCTEAKKAFELMLDGTDQPTERRRAEEHVAGCGACAEAWTEMRRVRAAVSALPEGKPSSSVVYRLLAAAGVPAKPKQKAKAAKPGKKRRRMTKGIIALLPAPMLGLLPGKAAAAAAAVVFGSSIGLLTGITYERVIDRGAADRTATFEAAPTTLDPGTPAPRPRRPSRPTVERSGGSPTVWIASIPRV